MAVQVKRPYTQATDTPLIAGKHYLLTTDGLVTESTNDTDVQTQMDKVYLVANPSDPRYAESLERNIVALMKTKMDKSNIQPLLDAINSQGLASTLLYQLPQPTTKINTGDWVAATPNGYVKANTADITQTEVIGLCTAVTATNFTITSIGMTSVGFTATDGSPVYLQADGTITATKPATGIIKKVGAIFSNKIIVSIAPTIKVSVDSVASVPTAIRTNIDNQIIDLIPLNSFNAIQLNIEVKGDTFMHSFIAHVSHEGNGQMIVPSIVSDNYVGIDPLKKVTLNFVKSQDGLNLAVMTSDIRLGCTAKVRRILF